jgi:hypothetical protein
MIGIGSLDGEDREKLSNAIDRLGGHEHWGVRQVSGADQFNIHPGIFMERLLPWAAATVNASLENDPRLDRRARSQGGPCELQLSEKWMLWQLGFSETDIPER